MNQYAQIMFEMVDRHIDSQVERICSHAIYQLKDEATAEQHQILRADMRHEMENLVFSFLGTFDNVGCGLPEEILGYSIKIRTRESSLTDKIDMRENKADYADMWLNYLYNKG